MKINDPVYITANFYHPQSGYSINADATPAWTVYESGAQVILQGSMISRGMGSYWANFMATAANGFNTGLFYDVEVSGAVGGVTGFASVKSFILGEILDANVVQVSGEDVTYASSTVNANVVQVSGEYVSIDDFGGTSTAPTVQQIRAEMDANSLQLVAISGNVSGLAGAAMRGTDSAALASSLTSVSGIIPTPTTIWANATRSLTEAVSVSGIPTVNVVQVSGIPVSIGDFGGGTGASAAEVWTYGGARSLNTAVSVSGIPDVNVVSVSGEAVGLQSIVDANVVQLSGVPVSPQDAVDANVVSISGVPVSMTDTVEANVVQVSGVDVTLGDFNTGGGASTDDIWSHADRSLTQAVSVSGIPDVNIVQVSGTPVSLGDLQAADVSALNSDIYFAQIKWISDLTNNRDEFAVQWYKNDQPVGSGDLTNPRISAYNTATGTALFAGQPMAYASPLLGVVRYNHSSMVFASGEPYLVETSGTIDSVMRIWKNIVGIDLL
jgi:hypothetical protein